MRQTKEQRTAQIIEILTDTSIPFPNRTQLCVILDMHRQNLYSMFTTEEIDALYSDALAHRREKLKERGAEVDEALLLLALAGDVQAIKLYYQRHEGWSPSQSIEGSITHHFTLAERMLQLEKDDAILIEGGEDDD
jgi:hypothetical protein